MYLTKVKYFAVFSNLQIVPRDGLQTIQWAHHAASTGGVQGLCAQVSSRYFAADAARAFVDLETLVRQLGELGLGKEWEVQHVELLKAAKLYLKGDFKVSFLLRMQICIYD